MIRNEESMKVGDFSPSGNERESNYFFAFSVVVAAADQNLLHPRSLFGNASK